jgi:PAS domain S-box-containing protein
VAAPGTDVRRLIATSALIAVAYVLAARLGFQVAFVAEQVTTVWAPTGIAVAALLLWGRSLWPSVWLGAFIANLGTRVPVWAAAAVATGNTLEAVTAAIVLQRLSSFDPTLRRVRDASALIGVGALACTTLSATIGVAALCAAGAQPWTRFGPLWSDWWLGDALGALVVAPAILTLARSSRAELRRDWLETSLLLAATAVTAQLVFGGLPGAAGGPHPLEYALFPLVITAAVRLAQPATALVVLVASALTIWNTVGGAGPFAGGEVHASLVLLQVFMAVLAGTGLLLAAATAERRTSERRRAAAYAVGSVLTDAPDLEAAAPRILGAICETLGWQAGALWLVERAPQHLACLAVWVDESPGTPIFMRATRAMTFRSGVGLPGRVWATASPAWINDVVRDPNFPRAAVAAQADLHGAFAFPIRLGDDVLGVIEIFNRAVLTSDTDLLRTISAVGHHVGQFIGRKRIETAMALEQDRTRAILGTALDPVIGIDHQGLITYFNPAAERTFGWTQAQALGRDLAELLIPESLRLQHREGLSRYVATGLGRVLNNRMATIARHADGHEFPVEVAITRVSGDVPPRFTGFVRDLTARVRAERERDALLQRELSARQEAEAANRAKDEFLATLSHELRTPLNAIIGWSRMLLDRTMDDRSTKHALEVIYRNASLQAQLVNDILDVSGIITGGLRIECRPTDLAAVIRAALDAVRLSAEAKGTRIRTNVPDSPVPIDGDAQRLQQVVWNLLANAVKFTPAGGLVEVTLTDDGGSQLEIRVQDNGAGIDPAFLPHVFERFRQADGSASRQHGGLGLGLAIVRHLVELHGGTVRVESGGLETGATFTVSLPRAGSGRAISSDGGHVPVGH